LAWVQDFHALVGGQVAVTVLGFGSVVDATVFGYDILVWVEAFWVLDLRQGFDVRKSLVYILNVCQKQRLKGYLEV
jgi:hypothetical protein